MSVSKTGIPFDKRFKDSGFFFKANYVINGLNSNEVNKTTYKNKLVYDSPKKLGKQIEYLGLSDYLFNHKINAKVYLYVENLIGERGYNGFKTCNFYVEAKWMDLETRQYHKTSSNMSQGEYWKLMKMLNVTYLEN